jgi:hypothetical protein
VLFRVIAVDGYLVRVPCLESAATDVTLTCGMAPYRQNASIVKNMRYLMVSCSSFVVGQSVVGEPDAAGKQVRDNALDRAPKGAC